MPLNKLGCSGIPLNESLTSNGKEAMVETPSEGEISVDFVVKDEDCEGASVDTQWAVSGAPVLTDATAQSIPMFNTIPM